MLNFSNILLNTNQPKELAEFYEKVFEKKPDMHEGEYYGWVVGDTFFSVGGHSEIQGKTKEPQRVLFNFDTTEVKEEFERIKKIDGADVIKEPYTMGDSQMWIATLADPDGNYFQLMTPWEQDTRN